MYRVFCSIMIPIFIMITNHSIASNLLDTSFAQTDTNAIIISPENVDKLTPITSFGYGRENDHAWLGNETLLVATPTGLWSFDINNPAKPMQLVDGDITEIATFASDTDQLISIGTEARLPDGTLDIVKYPIYEDCCLSESDATQSECTFQWHLLFLNLKVQFSFGYVELLS